MIFKAARATHGACGPSHMDADHMRFILTNKNFKVESKNLREQIAKLTRVLATRHINPQYLESYVCCRLIALDKKSEHSPNRDWRNYTANN